jgi:hypothetical protein
MYSQVDGMFEISKDTTELYAPENAWIFQMGRVVVSRTRRLTGNTICFSFPLPL